MKKIIAFGGSNSSTSINKQLAEYALSLLNDVEGEVLDLNNYELPLYGIDKEKEIGIPENAHKFLDAIKTADGIIVSLAEHNGAYTVAFKNLFDWMSRIDQNVWSDKPMLLMAAAPGARGGASVLEIASGKFPRMGANIINLYSLPKFHDNFKNGEIADNELKEDLKTKVEEFEKKLEHAYTT